MKNLDSMTDTQVWDELSKEPGFGVIPNWNGPKYRIRDLVERQKQLGRFLTEEERKEFLIQEEPTIKNAYPISDGVLIIFSDGTVRIYGSSVINKDRQIDASKVLYRKGTPVDAIPVLRA